MARDKDGAHASHCCARHGCKYGPDFDVITGRWTEKNCPVANGRLQQEGPCEYCVNPYEARKEIRELEEAIAFVEGLYKTKETG